MQDKNYKCSKHKDTDAIRCCGECNAFYCNKCEKHHSEILKNHQTFQIDKDSDELFTGFCQKKNIKMNSIIYVKTIISFAVLFV